MHRTSSRCPISSTRFSIRALPGPSLPLLWSSIYLYRSPRTKTHSHSVPQRAFLFPAIGQYIFPLWLCCNSSPSILNQQLSIYAHSYPSSWGPSTCTVLLPLSSLHPQEIHGEPLVRRTISIVVKTGQRISYPRLGVRISAQYCTQTRRARYSTSCW